VTLVGSGRVLIGKPAFPLNGPRMRLTFDEARRGVQNEAAAWTVARQLGVAGLVPVTVVRTLTWPQLGETLVSLQVPWGLSAMRTLPLAQLSATHVTQAAVFDTLIRQTDRGPFKNWAAGDERPAAVYLYDNALAFGLTTRAFGGQTSWFYGVRAGTRLPAEMAAGLENVVGCSGTGLHDLLPADEVENMLARARRMLEVGEVTI
jgi:hypothetical protein